MRRPRELEEVFLQPGDLHFGDHRTRIRTLLGSCVSMVFWHPQRLLGGMCHFMLPSRPRRAPGCLDGRYGDEATELMLQKIRAAGAKPDEFRVRLYGGGNMFPDIGARNADNVGRRNVEAANQLLKRHRLVCTGAHVEGVGHRVLAFDIWSGHVTLRLPGPATMPPAVPSTKVHPPHAPRR